MTEWHGKPEHLRKRGIVSVRGRNAAARERISIGVPPVSGLKWLDDGDQFLQTSHGKS